jgi:hypothetical protein
MKSFLFTLLPIMLVISTLHAQTNIPAKAREAGIEIGGTGLIYNVYFQQKLANLSENTTFNLRLGGAPVPYSSTSEHGAQWGYNLNITPTVLFFKKRHAWETGIACNFFDFTHRNEPYIYNGQPTKRTQIQRTLLLAPQASYRYYFKNSPFYFRGTLLVHIGLKNWGNYGADDFPDPGVIPWAGLSGGITF